MCVSLFVKVGKFTVLPCAGLLNLLNDLFCLVANTGLVNVHALYIEFCKISAISTLLLPFVVCHVSPKYLL